MKNIILIALAAITISAQAQPVYVDRIGFNLESIADIDIGWMEIRKHAIAPKAKQNGNRIYSATQIGYSQQFVEWMQQSYLPKGCLGNATYFQNYIYRFSPTNSLLGNAVNQHRDALPHSYGAQTKIFIYLKKDEKGKFVPQNNLGDNWQIEANQLESITTPVSFISSADEYYFLWTNYKAQKVGYPEYEKIKSNLFGFDTHKNIKPYHHFYTNSQHVVVMTKDNAALPFEQITIGDFFTEAEKQFPNWQKIEALSNDKLLKAQNNLIRLKKKYKSNWNEIAELKPDAQINLYSFVNANEGYDDIFDKNDGNARFPILKVTKTAKELCKKDQPQWLVMRWTLSLTNESYAKHLQESILNNFNFEYFYNFFFAPEKVKGQSYKPLHSPTLKEEVTIKERSEKATEIIADKNVFFYDDFSNNAVGYKPIGWQAKLNAGTTAVVTNLDGLDGNWVQLRGHSLNALALKKPLPQNFTLTYDVVAPQNFTWGAKGLTLQLSRETSPGNAESFIKLKVRPGSNGSNGEATLETKFPYPPGYLTGSKWFAAEGFSNNKKNNRIAVTIKKLAEKLEVYINGKSIAVYQKAIPDAHLFNALSFDCSGNSAENDTYYISNIKITKD